jgi:hypothetical protein
MPTWPSSVSLRGEALASTSLGLRPALRPVGLERASSWRSVSRRGLSVRVSALISAALGEFMRCVFRGVDRGRQCPRDAAKIKQLGGDRGRQARWPGTAGCAEHRSTGTGEDRYCHRPAFSIPVAFIPSQPFFRRLPNGAAANDRADHPCTAATLLCSDNLLTSVG